MKRYKEALAVYNRSIQLNPNDPQAYGITFIAPTSDVYQITFVDGAYTTYKEEIGFQLFSFIKNKQIEFQSEGGLTNFDNYIGVGDQGNNPATATAYAKMKRRTVNFSLHMGDALLFVAADVQDEYGDNMGQVVLGIELIQ